MNNEPLVVIAGATGIGGSEIMTVLEASPMAVSQLRLLASEDSAGEVYKFRDEEVSVELMDDEAFAGADIVFFATSPEITERFAPAALESGASLIDCSGFYARRQDAELVLWDVNPDAVSKTARVYAIPGAAASQLAPLLWHIHQAAGLKRVVLSTYHSVSGAGKAALDELWGQTISVFNQQAIEVEELPHQIAFNCIPQIDLISEDGSTREENKLVAESRRLLGLPTLAMTVTAVRVPVFYSHAMSLNVEFEKELAPETLCALLEKQSGLQVHADFSEYPMQSDASGNDDILVGRIRRDQSVAHGLNLWLVADNVRRGIALPAVNLARLLAEKRG